MNEAEDAIDNNTATCSASNPSANKPQLEGREIKDSPYKLIGKCFAAGSFGEIHLTHDTKTGEIFATKLVYKENPNAKLRYEFDLYKKLGPAPGLPKVLFYGECDPYDAMVMELLGPSLERVFISCNQQFSVRTTTQIAVQILEIIRYIHSQKIIFCNCKPDNFCLGRPNTPNANQLHLIGFIHAKTFETEHHEHIPKTRVDLRDSPKRTSGVFGTPRYMSLNAHKGKVLSRRDDLESIGYMLLYFLRGKLPWQGLQIANELEKYERIYSMKKTIKLEELFQNLPPEYYHYLLYVRSCKFKHEPNYQYLIKMFTKLLHRINLEKTSSYFAVYDWDEQQKQPQAVKPSGHSLQSTPPLISNTSSVPFRKQVSFKEDHESLSIVSDMYFPFARNTAYTEDYINFVGLRQAYSRYVPVNDGSSTSTVANVVATQHSTVATSTFVTLTPTTTSKANNE